MSQAAEVLRLMNIIELNVVDTNITATTIDGSLCLFRPVYDKPSGTTYGMSSAINTFQRGQCFCRVYCVEQFNSEGLLVKFNIQLKNENDLLLGIWDLDLNHGLHTHPVNNGEKGRDHIRIDGSIYDVAIEIAAQIKQGV